MASYGTNTIHRPTSSQASTTGPGADEANAPGRNRRSLNFKLIFPFNIPSTPEAAAVRIIRNLGYFRLYYILFVWVVLFIALLPKRKVSLIFLLAMTVVTSLYFLLLRSFPNSILLNEIVDKRLVLALIAIVTVVEMILTRAGIHFFVTLAATMPIILVHAALRVRENLYAKEEESAAGELVPLTGKKPGEAELQSSV